MTSLILRTASRIVRPLLLLFSVFLLVRGHNEPGGGFVGGLVAATAFALYAIAFGPEEARRSLRLDPRTLVGAGLVLALAGGVGPVLAGEPFLTGRWTELRLFGAGAIPLGTPLLFDVGVYLIVVGFTLSVILSFAEEE
jgi:multicomponent Na+:H+ antiporter subunit B